VEGKAGWGVKKAVGEEEGGVRGRNLEFVMSK